MTPHLLLFGASGGIASQLISDLHPQGWHITAVSRNPENVNALDNVTTVQGDATVESGVQAGFKEAEASGEITAVVNCLGNVFLKPIHRTSPSEFTEVMRLHVFSSFLILHEACARLKTGSSIVLFSSVAARTGLPNHETISAAKGAVEGLVRSTAATYASKGIRVNAVAPGLTETPATTHLCQSPAREVSEKMHPLGRIGRPEDITAAVTYFIDPANSWVTGQILNVDGGLGHLRGLPKN
jgi:NAD(P)-dependent dehydrogenase (short-subunit alcohol dehydrogenase family)